MKTHPSQRSIKNNLLLQSREEKRLANIKFWEDDAKYWEEEIRKSDELDKELKKIHDLPIHEDASGCFKTLMIICLFVGLLLIWGYIKAYLYLR